MLSQQLINRSNSINYQARYMVLYKSLDSKHAEYWGPLFSYA